VSPDASALLVKVVRNAGAHETQFVKVLSAEEQLLAQHALIVVRETLVFRVRICADPIVAQAGDEIPHAMPFATMRNWHEAIRASVKEMAEILERGGALWFVFENVGLILVDRPGCIREELERLGEEPRHARQDRGGWNVSLAQHSSNVIATEVCRLSDSTMCNAERLCTQRQAIDKEHPEEERLRHVIEEAQAACNMDALRVAYTTW
jgi:hypothetical protein